MAGKKKRRRSAQRKNPKGQRRKRKLRAPAPRTATEPRKMSPAFLKFEQRLLAILKDAEKDQFAVGLFWNELVKTGLAEKDLGQSPRQWWKEHVGSYCEPRTAVMLGRIVKHYDADMLAAEGDKRLDHLIAYCRKGRVKPPANPGPFPIQFKDPDGNKHNKPFSDCAEQEMEWAVRPPGHPSKPKKAPPPLPPTPPEQPDRSAGYWEEEYVLQIGIALGAIGEAGRPGRDPQIEWIDDQPYLSVRGISWPHIRQVGQALIDVLDHCVENDHWPTLPHPPLPDWVKGSKDSP
jgi:hypothetical protein